MLFEYFSEIQRLQAIIDAGGMGADARSRIPAPETKRGSGSGRSAGTGRRAKKRSSHSTVRRSRQSAREAKTAYEGDGDESLLPEPRRRAPKPQTRVREEKQDVVDPGRRRSPKASTQPRPRPESPADSKIRIHGEPEHDYGIGHPMLSAQGEPRPRVDVRPRSVPRCLFCTPGIYFIVGNQRVYTSHDTTKKSSNGKRPKTKGRKKHKSSKQTAAQRRTRLDTSFTGAVLGRSSSPVRVLWTNSLITCAPITALLLNLSASLPCTTTLLLKRSSGRRRVAVSNFGSA